jgi:hypothetical protein
MPDAGAGLRAPARTAVLLRERPGPRSRVEGIERFAKTEAAELVTALLYRLNQRGPIYQ